METLYVRRRVDLSARVMLYENKTAPHTKWHLRLLYAVAPHSLNRGEIENIRNNKFSNFNDILT